MNYDELKSQKKSPIKCGVDLHHLTTHTVGGCTWSRCIFMADILLIHNDEYVRCRCDFFCLLQHQQFIVYCIFAAAAAAALTLYVTTKHFSRIIENTSQQKNMRIYFFLRPFFSLALLAQHTIRSYQNMTNYTYTDILIV